MKSQDRKDKKDKKPRVPAGPRDPAARREQTVVVPLGSAGARLDVFLAARFPRFSRRRLARVLKEGWVKADGRTARGGLTLKGGEEIHLPALEEAVERAARRASPADGVPPPDPNAPPVITVLHRDDDLLVVSKPWGVPCHGGAGLGATKTLVDLLRADVLLGFGLVHRIDRDTTGAVALVRDPERRAVVAAAFAAGKEAENAVEKAYDAIVQGVPEPSSGVIDLPLADPSYGGKGRVDSRRGRPARTEYAVLEVFDGAARVRVVPWTGRTHQIRIHLAAIGHPLLVDPLYGRRSGWRMVDPKGGPAARLTRTPLHAAELTLTHPTSGERITVKAPLYPDHRRALEVLRVTAGRATQKPGQG